MRSCRGSHRALLDCLAAALVAACLACAPGATRAQSAASGPDGSPAAPTDVGWPREVSAGSSTITVYQPQLDSWQGNTLTGRAAVSVATEASPTPTFGVVWFSARTEVDKPSRLVTLDDFAIARTSFPGASNEQADYEQALRDALPAGAETIALDRIQANLSITQAEKAAGPTVAVKNAPPRIIFSDEPAILVLVDGKPALRQAGGDGNWLRVINTRALILVDQTSGAYYLYVMNGWARAASLDGPWSAVADPPAGLEAAKAAAVKGGQVDLLSDPGSEAKSELAQGVLPVLYVSTGPAELLQTDGKPSLAPIEGTQLLEVTNTTSDIFLDVTSQEYYVLISGRWFRSKSLTDGPWTFVASDALPASFANIPFNHPKGTALTSVAGTPQAKEAVISSTIPQTATVKRSEATMPPPQYDTEPKFEPIEGTSLQYAANTATPVIQVAPGSYYAVVNGVWFTGASPTGPWVVAAAVPPVIYTIPPSSPLYYVTYVKLYGATPDVVYVGYTPGYYGTYVAPYGTVVYGTGYVYDPWIGSVWIGPPYTYGFGAGFAWGAASGFALGFAAGAFCHPWWGPAGWGWGWGWGGNDIHVNVNETNIYNRWGKNTVYTSGNKFAGKIGKTTFAGEKGGDVYADRNGNLYRREKGGGWQKYDNGQWSDVGRKDQADASARAQDGKSRAEAGDGAQGLKDRAKDAGGPQGLEKLDQRQAGLGPAAERSEDLGALDRDWSARQAGDQGWKEFSQAGGADRRGGWGAGQEDRFRGWGSGGDRFGGGFRGFGGGGFRGGGFRR